MNVREACLNRYVYSISSAEIDLRKERLEWWGKVCEYILSGL